MAENLSIIWLVDQMWSWNKKLTKARGQDNVRTRVGWFYNSLIILSSIIYIDTASDRIKLMFGTFEEDRVL